MRKRACLRGLLTLGVVFALGGVWPLAAQEALPLEDSNWVSPDKFTPSDGAADKTGKGVEAGGAKAMQPLVVLPFRPLNMPTMPSEAVTDALKDVAPPKEAEVKEAPASADKPAAAEDTGPFSLDSQHWVAPKSYTPSATTEAEAPKPPPPPAMKPLNVPVLPSRAARAAPVTTLDDEPLSVDDRHWTSLDHFTDKALRFPQDAVPEEAPVSSVVVVPPPVAPVVAAPSRPLVFPTLPGMGFEVRVDTTEEAQAQETARQGLGARSALGLAESNWQSADQVARQAGLKAGGVVPLNIRMTRLPDAKIVPTPAGPATKNHIPAVEAQVPEAVPAPAGVSEEDSKLLAAVKAYKKKQLDALESDRQTLSKLQDAIAKLGLGNKMNAGGPSAPKPAEGAPSLALPEKSAP